MPYISKEGSRPQSHWRGVNKIKSGTPLVENAKSTYSLIWFNGAKF